MRQLLPKLYEIPMGPVNAFFIDHDSGGVLIDTGYPDSATTILEAVRSLGKDTSDIHHILVTHCHPDHAGGSASLARETGASTYMHPLDAALVREGKCIRDVDPEIPGVLNWMLFQVFIRNALRQIEPAEIDVEVQDRETLQIAGGIQIIHAPGHSAGQVTFLWKQHGGVLFAADAASNIPNLRLSIVYESLEVGRRSLQKLASLHFDTACFGHGKAIIGGADRRFRKKWGS